jgi:mannose-6-phosphate isomerase-like protein (cupin superfamily)
VISGRGEVELDGSTTEIGVGDVAVNRPGGTHALRAIGDARLRMVVVCVDARDSDL